MGYRDDAVEPIDVTEFWCAACGKRIDKDTRQCAECRGSLITTKKRRMTWRDRRDERASKGTICGRRFAKDDVRIIVRMPKDVHPEWAPRTTTVHRDCAPLGLWPANWEGRES